MCAETDDLAKPTLAKGKPKSWPKIGSARSHTHQSALVFSSPHGKKNRLTRPLGRISLPIRSVTRKRRAIRGGQQGEAHYQPRPGAPVDSRLQGKNVSDSARLGEGEGEHADRTKDVGDELDVDEDPPLGDREEESGCRGDPEDKEADHVGRIECGCARHVVRDTGDRGEDAV